MCDGFCVQNENRFASIIMHSYLRPNPKIIEEITNKIDKTESDLKFEKAELLKKQKNILTRYYQILRFLWVGKNINYRFSENGETFHIRNGLLEKIESSSQIYNFPTVSVGYRDNELLAVEKSQLDEMWIVFYHLNKKDSKEIDRIFAKSISKFENSILS
jgi:hypothetical protein